MDHHQVSPLTAATPPCSHVPPSLADVLPPHHPLQNRYSGSVDNLFFGSWMCAALVSGQTVLHQPIKNVLTRTSTSPSLPSSSHPGSAHTFCCRCPFLKFTKSSVMFPQVFFFIRFHWFYLNLCNTAPCGLVCVRLSEKHILRTLEHKGAFGVDEVNSRTLCKTFLFGCSIWTNRWLSVYFVLDYGWKLASC